MTVRMAAVVILHEDLAEQKSVEDKVEGEKKQEKHSVEVLNGCRTTRKTNRKKQTCMKENETHNKSNSPQSNIRNAHRSAVYTTFITSELINRKSGGKATHISFKKTEGGKQKAAHSNIELTCPREKERG